MNRLFLLLCSMLLCGLVSCSGAGKSNETVKAVEKTDSCKLDAKNTYEVYLPVRNNAFEKLPVLVIIDSHGSGKFALDKFKQGAKQYQVVLIASNLIKNGFTGYEAALQTLIDDVRQKYPVGETLFLSGFSGGARMALGYALTHPINGLIMCGALANENQLNMLHYPVISISGMDDFNFMETAQYLFNEQSTPANLKIELTNDSHSWPDSSMLDNALGFLSFSCQKAKMDLRNDSQFNRFCRNQLARINTLKQQGDFLKATLVARNMTLTKPFDSDTVFSFNYNSLKSNSNYVNQLNRLEKCIIYENNVRQPYIEAFRTKDTQWWEKEIRITLEKIKTEKDSYTRDMYRRIKGFWGIVSYSLCKQAINEHDAAGLNKILSVYSMLEPENPDMIYFSAFTYFWRGNNETTVSTLKKALKAGFSDRSQLKNDFPETITSKLL